MNRKSREGTQPIQGCGFTLPQSQGAPPFLVLLLALPADYPASGHIRPIWVIGKGGDLCALRRNPVGIQFSGRFRVANACFEKSKEAPHELVSIRRPVPLTPALSPDHRCAMARQARREKAVRAHKLAYP